jgi:hypothetical protein
MDQLTEQGVWRIRTNQDLMELYISDLVADIDWRGSEWLGHMIRMDQTRVGG